MVSLFWPPPDSCSSHNCLCVGCCFTGFTEKLAVLLICTLLHVAFQKSCLAFFKPLDYSVEKKYISINCSSLPNSCHSCREVLYQLSSNSSSSLSSLFSFRVPVMCATNASVTQLSNILGCCFS